MTFARIFGILFSGFVCRLYGAGIAIWVGLQSRDFLIETMAAASKGLTGGQ